MGARRIRRVAAICMMLTLIIGTNIPALAQETSQETIVGILSEGEYGLELKAGDKTYVLEDYLPEDLIGRKVKVVGSVEEGQDGTLFFNRG
jgi:hypothetical protein